MRNGNCGEAAICVLSKVVDVLLLSAAVELAILESLLLVVFDVEFVAVGDVASLVVF